MSSPLSSERDTNFVLPIPDVLENDKVKLVPFIPSEHAQALVDGFDDETFMHLPGGPYDTAEQFVADFYEGMRKSPSSTTFTIFDKAGPLAVNGPVIAGMASLINSSDHDACTEIGFIVILPKFQRTHVTSNMVGLFLHFALDLPDKGGLGLRRVQWVCSSINAPSLKVAQRMGFRFEGVLRWTRVLPYTKATKAAPERKGDPRAGFGARDSTYLSVCWDDWEGQQGVRDWVDKVMARTG